MLKYRILCFIAISLIAIEVFAWSPLGLFMSKDKIRITLQNELGKPAPMRLLLIPQPTEKSLTSLEIRLAREICLGLKHYTDKCDISIDKKDIISMDSYHSLLEILKSQPQELDSEYLKTISDLGYDALGTFKVLKYGRIWRNRVNVPEISIEMTIYSTVTGEKAFYEINTESPLLSQSARTMDSTERKSIKSLISICRKKMKEREKNYFAEIRQPSIASDLAMQKQKGADKKATYIEPEKVSKTDLDSYISKAREQLAEQQKVEIIETFVTPIPSETVMLRHTATPTFDYEYFLSRIQSPTPTATFTLQPTATYTPKPISKTTKATKSKSLKSKKPIIKPTAVIRKTAHPTSAIALPPTETPVIQDTQTPTLPPFPELEELRGIRDRIQHIRENLQNQQLPNSPIDSVTREE